MGGGDPEQLVSTVTVDYGRCHFLQHYSMGLGPCSTYWLLVLSVIPAAVIVIQLSNSIQ